MSAHAAATADPAGGGAVAPDARGTASGRRLLHEAAAVLRPLLPTLAYTLRTMLAIGIALYTAFALQLLSPMSAVTTVLIVANPVTGALVSKSLWRLFGTILGATVAVALFAWFAQSPILFTVALSLCIGVACIVSSLLRYFRAYAAVLAGYTIIIVASGSFADPQNIFIGALSRVSAVSVGLLSAALVFLLTSLPMPSRLMLTIDGLVRDIAGAFVLYRSDRADWPRTLPRAELLRRANALDEQIEYAAADSYMVRRRMTRLRLGAARLLGLLSTLEPLHDRLSHHHPDASAARLLAHETMEMLAALQPGKLADVLPRIEDARARVLAIAARTTDPAALTVVLHESDLLDQLAHAVGDLTGHGKADTQLVLRPYYEWPTAFRNGLRGALVTLIGGLFWYATQWTAGPTMLAFVIPGACLLSTNPSASQASIKFATGALLAIPSSMFCQIFLLPQIAGFPLLWASICLCLAPGIWLQFSPKHGLRAFGYVVFFNAMVNIHNPITYDDIGLFNTWEAFLLGAACIVMVFRVLLPANPARDVNRLAASLGRAIELLAWPRWRFWPTRLPVWETWQNQQMQKILRLIQRMQQGEYPDQMALLQGAFAVVALGRVVLTLQALRRDPALTEAGRMAALQGLRALRRLRAAPDRAVAAIEAAANAVEPMLLAPARATPTDTRPSSVEVPDESLADHEPVTALRGNSHDEADAAMDAARAASGMDRDEPDAARSNVVAVDTVPRTLRLLVGALGEAALLTTKIGPLTGRRRSE